MQLLVGVFLDRCDDFESHGVGGEEHTLLEQSPSQVVQRLSRTSWELLELLEQRTDRCRHLERLDVNMDEVVMEKRGFVMIEMDTV